MLYEQHFRQYTRPLEPISTGLTQKGSLQKPLRCLLFDVYGTLFISSSGDISATMTAGEKDEGLKQLFQQYGIKEPRFALQSRMFRAVQDAHARLRKEGCDYPEVQIDAIWMAAAGFKDRPTARAFALAYDLIVNPVFPMPHLKRLLRHCRTNKKALGIISNAQFYTPLLFEWFLGEDLEALGFDPDLLMFSYRFNRAKPSRFLFNMARQALETGGIPPGQVLYVGNDMLNDILPARETGFQTALFAGDARSLRMRADNPLCAGIAPDMVITDLTQLVDFLQ